MFVRAGLVLLGLFHLGNGLWMLAAPDGWYAAVPGVSATGPINHHFIADIGLAFVASGAGLLLGARNIRSAGAFAIAGATWPVLHALLHLWGWIHMGLPAAISVALSEAVGVVLIGALGAALTWLRFTEQSREGG
jgi:hypothetical protein